MATRGDAAVVNPEGQVVVGPAVGGAGDPEVAAADSTVGQRSKVVESGMRGTGYGVIYEMYGVSFSPSSRQLWGPTQVGR